MNRISPFRWTMAACLATCVFPGCRGTDDTSRFESGQPPLNHTITFSDATTDAGLGSFIHVSGAEGKKWFPETMGSGGGFIDYNGDHWPDILLVGGGVWAGAERDDVRALWLYRNNGDGTFSDQTTESGLAAYKDYGMGITVGDYDNDGDEDFYFTSIYENRLLRNDGGRFTDVASSAGVAGEQVWSSAALFLDADRDGLLDLYVGNYVYWSPDNDLRCSTDGRDKVYCTPQLYEGAAARFYRNVGEGRFVDATAEAALAGAGKTLGAVELDYDRDGWPDIVVANDTNADHLFHNKGDGSFEDVGVISGMAFDEHGRARAGMGIDVGDVDGDGKPTIVVGNFSDEMIGFYKYLDNGVFVDRAATSQIGRPSLRTLTFGLFLFDVDLDGDLDLFTANGHVQQDIEKIRDNTSYRESPHLFENMGSGTFEDVAAEVGGPLTKRLVARGAAYADYDGDGDLDILVTENDGPVHLWRNDIGADKNFVRVETVGTSSNRSGVGAAVMLSSGGHMQRRRVRTGGSYLSQSELALTFGLGSSAGADSVVITWPSGHVDRLYGVRSGETIVAVEAQIPARHADPLVDSF